MLLKHPGVQISDSTVQVQTPSPTAPASETAPSTPSTTPLALSTNVPAGLPSSIYLASRVELPKTLNLTKAVPLQPVSTGPPRLPEVSASASTESKEVSKESKGVEPQKKTVETVSPDTARQIESTASPPVSPVVSPQLYILPIPEALLQSRHRDQTKPAPKMVVVDESKKEGEEEKEPVIPKEEGKKGVLGTVTVHEVELSTATPKLALSHKLFLPLRPAQPPADLLPAGSQE